MIQPLFGVKQLNKGKTKDVLCSFVWNYVKYTNMEGSAETVTFCLYS